MEPLILRSTRPYRTARVQVALARENRAGRVTGARRTLAPSTQRSGAALIELEQPAHQRAQVGGAHRLAEAGGNPLRVRQMPEMDGFEFCAASAGGPRVPRRRLRSRSSSPCRWPPQRSAEPADRARSVANSPSCGYRPCNRAVEARPTPSWVRVGDAFEVRIHPEVLDAQPQVSPSLWALGAHL